jgi:hypothetical protein
MRSKEVRYGLNDSSSLFSKSKRVLEAGRLFAASRKLGRYDCERL